MVDKIMSMDAFILYLWASPNLCRESCFHSRRCSPQP